MTDISPPRPRSHGNNFDGLRLAASLMVLFSHQFVLLGMHESILGLPMTLGNIAVAMFFVMSGYLVTESWYNDPHIMRFAMRRFLRIWPALMVAAVVIAIAGAVITSIPIGEYFGRGMRRFVMFNAQLRPVYSLPGVFETTPVNTSLSAVNGSWWTIPVEARCYAYVAILGAIGLRQRLLSLLALAVVALMYFKTLPGHSLGNAFDNLCYYYSAFFLTGVCARQFDAEIRRHWLRLVGVGVACLLTAALIEHIQLAAWVVIAPLTLWLGLRSTPGLRAAARFGDLSYGIYLYAFFVQQLSVRYWPATHSYVTTTVVATIVTALLGWCSWHAAEAPALSLKRRLRHWFPDLAP
ncbi:acyltransferase family protein [Dyella sp. Tek66A03]|uniref:acyltransferase family protein n=1 Tax=Dyella sp. Tek66A03 TaxID=3458298 RepID=UPI00403EC15A